MAKIKVRFFLLTLLALTFGACSSALPEVKNNSEVPPTQNTESIIAPTDSNLETPTSTVAAIDPPSGNLTDPTEGASAEVLSTSLPTEDVRMNPREWSAWLTTDGCNLRSRTGLMASDHVWRSLERIE